MRALLWREFRVLTPLSGIAVGLWAVVAAIGTHGHALPIVGWLLGCFVLTERGSPALHEWENTWPVSRRQLWLSKVVACLVALALIGALVIVVVVVRPVMPPAPLPTGRTGLLHYLAPLVGLGEARGSVPHEATIAVCLALQAFLGSVVFSGVCRTTMAAAVFSLAVGYATSYIHLLLDGLASWLTTGVDSVGHLSPDVVPSQRVLGLLVAAVMLWASARGVALSPPLSLAERRRHTIPLAGLALLVGFAGYAVLRFAGPAASATGLAARQRFSAIIDPTVSPDGNHIALVGGTKPHVAGMHPDPKAGLWVMNPDGSRLRCLVRGELRCAQWLPDSRHLVFGRPHIPAHVWVPSRIGGNRRGPAAGLGPLASIWSVDGTSGTATCLVTDPVRGDCHASPGQRVLLAGEYACRPTPPQTPRRLEIPENAPILGWSADETKVYIGDPVGGDADAIAAVDVTTGMRTPGVAHAPVAPPDPPGCVRGETSATGELVATHKPPSMHPVPAPGQSRWWVWGTWSLMDPAVLVDRNSGARVDLAGPVLGGGISPDGRFVWFNDLWKGIGVVDTTIPGKSRRPTVPPGDVPRRLVMPSRDPRDYLFWSLDQRRVAFVASVDDDDRHSKWTGRQQVWVADADGGNLRMVFPAASAKPGEPPGLYREMGLTVCGWTADGQVVVSLANTRLLKVDPATRRQTELLNLAGARG